jgi:flotillin
VQTVGIRQAEQEREVGIARERSSQSVKEQEALTMQKQMAVLQVDRVRSAEIAREVQIVKADETAKTQAITAEGERQQTVILAEGRLTEAQLNAQGIRAEGEAKGAAEQAILMAPVNSQISLAKEIGTNEGYQRYLIEVRRVEMVEEVGKSQAQALIGAEVKVIANAGDVAGGVNNVMDLFTSKGGTQVGAALEALAQTSVGKEFLGKFGGKGNGHASA